MADSADLEAINKYFMETIVIKTPAAEKIKKEWMTWWRENKRDWTSYSDEEYAHARNMRNRLNLANSTTVKEKAHVEQAIKTGLTTEEMKGETRTAGTDGMHDEEEEPLIPTSVKVWALVGAGLITLGIFGKKLLGMTPAAKLVKYLP